MTAVSTPSEGRRLIPEDPVIAVQEALSASRRSPGYRECVRCIMDTTHAEIEFDTDGVCNFCRGYQQNVAARALAPEIAELRLNAALEQIRTKGRGRDYDCILGVSGGVDSSYLALKCKDWGLRPLLVQFDNGWNTELANNNIQALCESLGFDLHTYVVDWPEFRDLQTAFLRAGVANVEAPSDHGIFACIYRTALEKNIAYLLSGVNSATESNCPTGEKARTIFSYGYRYDDLVHLRALHRRFGSRPLKTFPTLGYWRRYWLERSGTVKRFDPLNYMPYIKAEAIYELQSRTKWRPYPGKHFESVITRFHQSYILPVKFGLDKRRLHLSGLIWSGQIGRKDAILDIGGPPCPAELLRQDFAYVSKKLNLPSGELLRLMSDPANVYSDYPNRLKLYQKHKAVMTTVLPVVRKLMGK
jgi:N-acetyl sugar amidotransferase